MQVRGITSSGRSAGPTGRGAGGVAGVGVVDGAIGPRETYDRLAALFPNVPFTLLPADWDGSAKTAPEILIVGIAASDASAACTWLKTLPSQTRVIAILHDADVETTRLLLRQGGAADVLSAPTNELALTSSLERLLATPIAHASHARPTGQVVAFLKAGGGVGATALASQAGAILARRGTGTVCLADLDLQAGVASAYLDLPDALTVMDCLSAGNAIAETPFSTALASHSSGLRLLAGPNDVVPLEAVTPMQVNALLAGLRRDTALTLLDLPSAWTAWTHHALQQADRIVLVTRLTVPGIQMARRQLRMLVQQLDQAPVTVVCNAVATAQTESLSLKAATKALGRSFDLVIPDDQRLMTAALNQGVELSTVKRGSKLEKAVAELATMVAADAVASAPKRRMW